ncbi:hypothetical protein DERP_007682 [Dermatophagoides pteronyssinus]|uniref:Uncharacterized protein n=1 Tax=Dermatophagoides pteronyssinus TaxID=6956 RepID=A0ABQ8JKF4_DERPT|nr:hypothetical protein DERP_007682 [Dermatophagoides pteronyssinus]
MIRNTDTNVINRVLGTQEYKLITYTFINRCSLLVMIINIWLHLQSCDSFASNKQTYKINAEF